MINLRTCKISFNGYNGSFYELPKIDAIFRVKCFCCGNICTSRSLSISYAFVALPCLALPLNVFQYIHEQYSIQFLIRSVISVR